MEYILYFLVALVATAAGSVTGMGGGIILKPVLDAMGAFDIATANLLSSITVFVMALVSVIKRIKQKTEIKPKMAVPLAAGSLLGGNAGQFILAGIISAFHADRMVVVLQNTCLVISTLAVFLYMQKGERRPTLNVKGVAPTLLTGILIGTLSTFLGIGGGPINVALLIFVCACDIKTAALYSIITILFAQASKLAFVLLSGKFFSHDLSILPGMVMGAVLGGWTGSWLNQRLSEKRVERAFNSIQVLVFIICLFNIFHHLTM